MMARASTRLPLIAGIGLRSMRERAERLPGGVFVIASTPNHGTIIRVECAL